MKRILISLGLVLLSTMFLACSKQPFVEKNLEPNAALVYTYVVDDDGVNDTNRLPCYKVHLGEEYTNDCMRIGEYMAFDVKPGQVEFNIARSEIEIQTLLLDLSAGDVKYLRVQSYSDDFAKFTLKDMPKLEALKELSHTVLVGSYIKKESLPSILVTPKEEKKVLSKSDELEKAHALKEKGILSDDEYEKLKAEILAK